jgi:hypothetical protein
MEKQLAIKEQAPTQKRNRHVVIALNHMNARRKALETKRAVIVAEIEELDAAIQALE